MFTGLVQGIGRVKERRTSSRDAELTVVGEAVDGLRLGDSIAVNGVCLTATRLGSGWFAADIMPETWRRTNLSLLKIGDPVNLEPAIKAGDPLGGHEVSGHVDAIIQLTKVRRCANAVEILFKIPDDLRCMVVDRGAVALNGVSLTVQGVNKQGFWVSLIPHTHRKTNLHQLRIGDWVNIEVDVMVKAMLQGISQKAGITLGTLQRYGFLR